MTDCLTAAQYDDAEASARRRVSNRIVSAFSSITFEKVGYPTRVAEESELAKYADVMQEHRFEQIWQSQIGGLSAQELALLKRVLEVTAACSKERFGRPILPRGSLLSSLNIFRAFEAVYGSADPKPTVLELGPGSGYLGLLFVLASYRYISFEVTQAFYLYQSGLLRSALGADFSEWAEGLPDGGTPQFDGNIRAIHVPWWGVGKMPKYFDAMTCNAMLSEMHPVALHFMLKHAREGFSLSRVQPLVLFHDWGFSDASLPSWYVNASFHQHGLGLLHRDDRITAYGPASANNGQHAHYPRLSYPPNIDVSIIRNYGSTPSSSIWEPNYYNNAANAVSKALTRLQAGQHSMAELKTIYRSLSVDPDAESEDEQFLRSCAP
jgi:hypothetical protein